MVYLYQERMHQHKYKLKFRDNELGQGPHGQEAVDGDSRIIPSSQTNVLNTSNCRGISFSLGKRRGDKFRNSCLGTYQNSGEYLGTSLRIVRDLVGTLGEQQGKD